MSSLLARFKEKQNQAAASAPAPTAKPNPVKAKPAPEPEPEAVEVQAEVVSDTPEQTRAVTAFDPFAMILGGDTSAADAVLAVALDMAENTGGGGNFDGPFPLVSLAKGNSGGKWQLAENASDPEVAMRLPVAAKDFTAVFLGVRIYGLAWPEKYSDDKKTREEKDKPLWKVEIGSGDVENFQTALQAGEVYQFTPGKDKDKFDGLGHFRPGVEMLFWRDGIVFAMRLPDNYTSTIRALQSLGKVMAGVGGMRALPVSVTPYTTDEGGAKAWKCHSVRIEAAATKEGVKAGKDFAAIRQDLLNDQEFSDNFAAWNATNVEGEGALEALAGIAALKKK